MTKKEAVEILNKALARSKTSSERVLVNKNALETALCALRRSLVNDIDWSIECGPNGG